MYLCYNYKLTPILDIYEMCAFKFSLSSIITPKNFVLVTLFIVKFLTKFLIIFLELGDLSVPLAELIE